MTRTDKRVERSRAGVLAETYRLMTEMGIGGVSVDEIARRSGIAKTTIYRQWPSRSALLLDACSQLGATAEVPDTGTLASDLAALLRGLADALASPGWPTVLPSIIDAAERDPETAKLHEALHNGMMSPFYTVAARGLARGELSPDRKASEVVAAATGPLFYRRWFSREVIDDAFLAAVLRTATCQGESPKPVGLTPDATQAFAYRGA